MNEATPGAAAAETEPRKLDAAQKHLLRLIRKGADPEGWSPVSSVVFPHAKKALPSALATLELVGDEGRGRAQLTPLGESLLDAMEWL